MFKFLIRRLIAVPITLFVITAILFAITLLAPIESRAQMYLPRGSRNFMPENQLQNAINRVIREYGLNDPFPVQYVRWASNMLHGNWGWSPNLRSYVLDVLLARTPATVELTLYSLLLMIPLGLLNGMMAGWRHGRLQDRGFRAIAYIATSIPPFILGLVLLSIFYVGFHWFPPDRLGFTTTLDLRISSFHQFTGLYTIDGLLNSRPDITFEALRHLALPVITLSLAHWATLGRVTRAAVIEELGKEYIVAARARGISNRSLIWRHAFLNAAPPALTSTALSAASLVTGVFVVEAVFAFPGVSNLITRGMGYTPDTALAVGFAVYSVIVVLLVMLILDIIQAAINPYVREEMIEA